MKELIITSLYATADKDGNYLDITDNIEEAERWLQTKDNPDSTQVIHGFGVIDKFTKIMPDNAIDFHYSYKEAEEELERLMS